VNLHPSARTRRPLLARQRGVTLVELMVGLVIGLLATLVIAQVAIVFEGQKRSTTGGSDAQLNGALALQTLQRDIQLSGYGIATGGGAGCELRGSRNGTVPPWNGQPMVAVRIVDGTDVATGSPDSLFMLFSGKADSSFYSLPIRVYQNHRRDGSEFPAAVAISPLTSQDGGLLGRVLSVRNVSQERQLEEQMRHTEKMVAVGELVAGVAHEINNPLTGISAFAQLLLEETLTDDQRESVALIKKETDRAKGVIHDLLLFARNTERAAGPVDINDALGQVVRLRAYPLRNGGVDVQLALDPSAPRVSGDAQKLQQVLLNIIGNAEYAMRDRPHRVLTLTTQGHGDTVSITATDTGKGMPEEVRRRIFEPFFTTKPNGVGTGLGLSVSYGIVRAHGGTVSVESVPDVGTTVTIVLPALSA